MSMSKFEVLPCILQCGEPCLSSDSLNNVTKEKWKNIEDKAKEWKDLDKFLKI